MPSPSQQPVPTGIVGLDAILEGGLLQGSVYVIRGQPGAGKTVLANHICFNLARGGTSCTYVSLLAEASDRMLAQLSRFAFYEPKLVGARVSYVAAYRVLQEGGIASVLQYLRSTAAKRPAQLIVLDGLQVIRDAASDVGELKRFVHDLQAMAMLTQSVVLLLSGTDPTTEVEPEHTIVDGIIELTDELSNMRALRHVRVSKMRGGSQLRGKHTLTIDDAGVTVIPRTETLPHRAALDTPLADEPRVSFGIAELDHMFGGGVPARSITMLVGPTGSGKTTLALQYLAAGAAVRERALYFGFYERPRELVAKFARVGLPLGDMADAGDLHFVWQAPVEGILDVLSGRLLAMVEQQQIRRLVIDGIHTFGRTIDFPERLPDALAALQTQLQKAGVTTVYTLESPPTFGKDLHIPIEDVSSTAHNIVLLRYVEVAAQRHRLISVVKAREHAHDLRTYEFAITDRGIAIADSHASAAVILATKSGAD